MARRDVSGGTDQGECFLIHNYLTLSMVRNALKVGRKLPARMVRNAVVVCCNTLIFGVIVSPAYLEWLNAVVTKIRKLYGNGIKCNDK